MSRFRSSNIVYKRLKSQEFAFDCEKATYKGIGKKLLLFAFFTLVGAALGIVSLIAFPNVFTVAIAVSGIFTFIFSLLSMISNKCCKITGPLYCVMEGYLVGALSILLSTVVQGVVPMALLSTIAVFVVVAGLYMSNIIKVGSGFKRFLLIFSLGFIVSQLLFHIIAFALHLEFSFGLILAVSFVSVFLATLYLFFDMENIRTVVEGGLPKEYEWTASFGLAFTLIWLYVEILRIVVLIAGRDN